MLDRTLEEIAASKPCCIEHCGSFGVDPHHRKQKSAGGSNAAPNILFICRRHHGWVHEHLEYSHQLGMIIWDHEDEPTEILDRVRIKPTREKPFRPEDSGLESQMEDLLK